jgi:deoxyribonuclease-1-like protein
MRYFILFFTLFSLVFSEDTALIASFNTLRLGKSKKDYYQFSKILSKFELIGLQEVMNENSLKILKGNLEKITGRKWEYHISEKPAGRGEYKEYFAYIWQKEKVNMKEAIGYYVKENESDFEREPYGAWFSIGNFDFIYVLAHSVYGKRERERILEAARYILVYEFFQKRILSEDDVIIAGDFNLPADNRGFGKFTRHQDQIEYILNPGIDLTTLGKKSTVNSYDNFFISMKHTKEFTGRYGVYNYVKNNYEEIRTYISDHLPIFIEINTSIEEILRT